MNAEEFKAWLDEFIPEENLWKRMRSETINQCMQAMPDADEERIGKVPDAMEEVTASSDAGSSKDAGGAAEEYDPFWDSESWTMYGMWVQSTEEYGFNVCPWCGKRPMLAFNSSPFAATCPRGCPRQLFVLSDLLSCLMYGADFVKHEMRLFWNQAVAIERNRMREEEAADVMKKVQERLE